MRDYIVNPIQEETELDEQFDFVLLDKDNKIVARKQVVKMQRKKWKIVKSLHIYHR